MNPRSFKKHLSEIITTIITEAQEQYKVARHEVIPHKQGKVVNPNGGKHAVLLKYTTGEIVAGVGDTKEEAIRLAQELYRTLFHK